MRPPSTNSGQFRGARAIPASVPILVRRLRIRVHRHRRIGACRHHVDRGRQSFQPQHLSRIHQSELQSDAGIAHGENHVACRQGRCADVIIFLPHEYAIQMQLLGGIWIIHTFPAVIFGLYTRWLNSKALLIGWAVE